MKQKTVIDIVFVILLLVTALIPRVLLLESIPLGIHGDEAWTALDAKEILEKGSLPIYSSSALGQPSGPAWLTALLFRFFGDSVYTLRLSMALFGIVTIPIFYLVLRKLFSQYLSFFVSMLLSFALFHLHYSRMGFMLISAPLFVTGTLYFFFDFLHNKSFKSLVLSAFICGVGAYSYNSYVLFPPTIVAALLALLLIKRVTFRHLVVFLIGCAIGASLLLYQIAQDPIHYFNHHKTISVMNQQEFKTADSWSEQSTFILQNGFKKTGYFFLGGHHDGADGFGSYQSIDYLILVLWLTGAGWAFVKKNRLMIWFVFAFLFQLIPLFTTVDGYYRREIVAYVLLYIPAAYALQQMFRHISRQNAVYLHIILILLAFGQISINLRQYFWLFPHEPGTQFVFPSDAYLGLQALRTEPYQDKKVILFSERYNCDYETFRYLLADRVCIDFEEDKNLDMLVKTDYALLYIDRYTAEGREKTDGNIQLLETSQDVVGAIQTF